MSDELELIRGTVLDHDLPDDPVQRVHRFARDLAWGAVNGLWPPRMVVEGNHFEFTRRHYQSNFMVYNLKWNRKEPSIHLLAAFGYLIQAQEGPVVSGLLTQKAFDLLERPAEAPSVFISYRRDQSSALALLVESRLKNSGVPNPFIDKNIPAGEKWLEHLHEHIQKSRYFICLIGPATLDSEIVRQEIQWAIQHNCTIVSVWHGCKMSDITHPPELDEFNAIEVAGESADAYENAVNKLLNSLGYATY